MPTTMEHSPEKVLLAILYKVGSEARLKDDFELARIFNEAAEKHGGIFDQFAWHPHYRVSDVLTGALQVLDHAGSIVRENAAQTYFKVSQHTAGPYGANLFSSLSADNQRRAIEIAERITGKFGDRNESGGPSQ